MAAHRRPVPLRSLLRASTTCSRPSLGLSRASRPSASSGPPTPAVTSRSRGIELYSGAVDSEGVYSQIATLNPLQSTLVARYGTPPVKRGLGCRGLPLRRHRQRHGHLDVRIQPGDPRGPVPGGASPMPSSQPANPIGQAVVASANYLTAGICLATGGHPATVCNEPGRPGRRRLARARVSRPPRAGAAPAPPVSRRGGPPAACAPSR